MYFKIHRGTKEIGGSCVEVWTENTRILLDFGMPLIEKDGTAFDFNKYKTIRKAVFLPIPGNLENSVTASSINFDEYIIEQNKGQKKRLPKMATS